MASKEQIVARIRAERERYAQRTPEELLARIAMYEHLNNDELLEALKEERSKYMDSNKAIMQQMVDELVFRGVYPPISGINEPPLKMVEFWGVNWHQYTGILNCPHCNADLRSPKGPPFKREIGISNGDSVMYWQCPDCKKDFPRFASSDAKKLTAEGYTEPSDRKRKRS